MPYFRHAATLCQEPGSTARGLIVLPQLLISQAFWYCKQVAAATISHLSCNAALHCPSEQVFGEGLSTVLADARAVLSEASLATTDFADTALAEFAGSSVQRGAAKTSAGLVDPSQSGNA